MITRNRIPINKMAAMVTSKAPWWAQPLPEKKKKKIKTPLKIEEIISVTNEPPDHIRNRIGLIFGGYTVIGYADSKDSLRKIHKSSGSKQPPVWVGSGYDYRKQSNGVRKIRWWWVIATDGEISRVKWDKIKFRGVGNFYGNILCRGCSFDHKSGRCVNTQITKQSDIIVNGKPDCYQNK